MSTATEERPVTGRVDADGRLVFADPPLAALNERAGGRDGGMLSVPQIAALARLSRRLGITVSRAAIAADGDHDVDLWVRAAPDGDEVALSITGWAERPAITGTRARPDEREIDFVRAGADWTWETDDTLRLTSLSAVTVMLSMLPLAASAQLPKSKTMEPRCGVKLTGSLWPKCLQSCCR